MHSVLISVVCVQVYDCVGLCACECMYGCMMCVYVSVCVCLSVCVYMVMGEGLSCMVLNLLEAG